LRLRLLHSGGPLHLLKELELLPLHRLKRSPEVQGRRTRRRLLNRGCRLLLVTRLLVLGRRLLRWRWPRRGRHGLSLLLRLAGRHRDEPEPERLLAGAKRDLVLRFLVPAVKLLELPVKARTENGLGLDHRLRWRSRYAPDVDRDRTFSRPAEILVQNEYVPRFALFPKVRRLRRDLNGNRNRSRSRSDDGRRDVVLRGRGNSLKRSASCGHVYDGTLLEIAWVPFGAGGGSGSPPSPSSASGS